MYNCWYKELPCGISSDISLELSPRFHPEPDYQCLKRICSLDTSAFSVLQVLDDNHAVIYLLTYLLTYSAVYCPSMPTNVVEVISNITIYYY